MSLMGNSRAFKPWQLALVALVGTGFFSWALYNNLKAKPVDLSQATFAPTTPPSAPVKAPNSAQAAAQPSSHDVWPESYLIVYRALPAFGQPASTLERLGSPISTTQHVFHGPSWDTRLLLYKWEEEGNILHGPPHVTLIAAVDEATKKVCFIKATILFHSSIADRTPSIDLAIHALKLPDRPDETYYRLKDDDAYHVLGLWHRPGGNVVALGESYVGSPMVETKQTNFETGKTVTTLSLEPNFSWTKVKLSCLYIGPPWLADINFGDGSPSWSPSGIRQIK